MAALLISKPVESGPFILNAQSAPYQSSGDLEHNAPGPSVADASRSLLLKSSLLPLGVVPYSPFAPISHSLTASVLAGASPELSIPDREYDDMKVSFGSISTRRADLKASVRCTRLHCPST